MQLKITWKRSAIGRKVGQKKTIAALGLKRLQHTVTHRDTPQIRGMIYAVAHLVEVEEIEELSA